MNVAGHDFHCRVADISAGGMRLEEVVLAEGEYVAICLTVEDEAGRLAQYRYEGRVRWSRGHRAGIQFC